MNLKNKLSNYYFPARRPRPHVSGYFWKLRFFFSVLASCPHVNGVFGHQKRRFSKTVPSVEFFGKRRLIVFTRTDRNGSCLITMMSYIIERMPCKGYHHISVVLAFSCGQTETIRIRYMWTRPYTVVNFFAALISWLFQDDPLSWFLCRISRIFSIAKLGIVVIVTFILW